MPQGKPTYPIMSALSSGANGQTLDHYRIAYETTFNHLVQQEDSRFGDKAIIKPAEGQATRFNQYGTRSFAAKTARTGATNVSDSSLPVRWAYSFPFEDALAFDEYDQLFLGDIVLPTSASMQSQLMAWNRTKDQVFLNNILGLGYVTTAESGQTSYTGGGGITPTIAPVAFSSSQVVSNTFVPFGGTAVTSGMTIAKIRRAKRILDGNEVPEQGRFLALSSKELEDLLATTEVTNQLYNSVKALVDGNVDHFLGFSIVRSELIPYYNASSESTYATNYTDAGLANVLGISGSFTTASYNNLTDISSTGIKACVAWQKDMVGIVDGGRKSHMDILPTASHALQIRSTGVIGAARLQEKGVVAILSDQNA